MQDSDINLSKHKILQSMPHFNISRAGSQKSGRKPPGTSGHDSGSFFRRVYRFTYIVGIQTVRILKRLRRRASQFFRPVTNLAKLIYAKTIGRELKKARAELLSIREGFQIAGKRISSARREGVRRTVAESVRVTGKSLIRHRGLFYSALNICAPLAALALLIGTVQYWNNLEYGLVLTYEGKNIATIQNETVFEQATEMVNQRMIHDTAEDEATVNISPGFQLSVVDQNQFAAPSAVCDLIIKQSNGIIEEASGLYVDGELLGAIKSSADLRYILSGILSAARGDDAAAEASFAQNVEMVTGLFPTTSIMTTEHMRELLTGTSRDAEIYTVKLGDTATSIAKDHNLTLDELNRINNNQIGDMLHEGDLVNIEIAVPRLSVQITKTQKYEVSLPYKTITEKDGSQYTDYSKVKTEGVNGRREVVDKTTYMNGVEIKRENISTTTLQNAVDKVVVTGTKKRPQNSGSGVSSGSMMWPVPSLHVITTYFEYRWGSFHSGIDISGGSAYGKTIVAADGGTVTAAGYAGSYGNRVQISHGNGLQTLYGHCSRLLVKPGQKVSKGQAIALVGSTGNSTGPHCHFEVYKNGSRQNPLNYVK